MLGGSTSNGLTIFQEPEASYIWLLQTCQGTNNKCSPTDTWSCKTPPYKRFFQLRSETHCRPLSACSNKTDPRFSPIVPSIPIKESRTGSKQRRFCTPPGCIFISTYRGQSWASACLDSWRMAEQCHLGYLTSLFSVLKLITKG